MSISTAWPPFTRVNDQNVFLGWVVIVVQDQLHICLSKVLNIVTSVHGSSEPQFCMFVFRYSLGSTFWDIQYVLKCQQKKKTLSTKAGTEGCFGCSELAEVDKSAWIEGRAGLRGNATCAQSEGTLTSPLTVWIKTL